MHRVPGLAAEMELAEIAQLGAALGLDARSDFRGEAEQHVAGLLDGLDDHQLFLGRRAVAAAARGAGPACDSAGVVLHVRAQRLRDARGAIEAELGEVLEVPGPVMVVLVGVLVDQQLVRILRVLDHATRSG